MFEMARFDQPNYWMRVRILDRPKGRLGNAVGCPLQGSEYGQRARLMVREGPI
jgi:hypothetical protein